jgi:glycosyltransferase involved in cell wall biosynthesis
LKSISKSIPHDYQIHFDNYGPVEDNVYYSECKNILNSIGDTIKVSFGGSLDYDKVVRTLSNYHLFLFPSKSENYGHVIHEALIASCPVIISDTTPWKGLEEKNVGYDINLLDTQKFMAKIIAFLNMNETEYNNFSKNAFNYGMEIQNDNKAIIEHKRMFELLLASKK